MTHESESARAALHRECWESIPWIANETLAPEVVARLEPHLRECAQCRNELEFQQRVRASMRADEPVMLAPQTGWQRLLKRLNAEEPQTPDESQPLTRDHADRRPTRSRALAIAVAVQAMALAFLLAREFHAATLTAPRFETLTSASPAPAPAAAIRVVFEPNLALQELNALLADLDAQIIAGPSESGVYTLALSAGRAAEEVQATLARLRADERIVFAESALSGSAP